MANYVLSCCSTADLSKEHFQSRDIHYVCFHYAMNGKEYLDDLGESMSFEDFYKAMADGADTRTSQVNISEYVEFFSKFLEQGLDVVHVCLSSGISGTINSFTPINVNAANLIIGIIVAAFCAMVLLGGLKRIGQVTERLVPFMAVIYIVSALIIFFAHIGNIGNVLRGIFVGAFTPSAVVGGVAGVTISAAIKRGVGRGVFSNEAGLGSAPIAHAAADNDSAVHQGCFGVFEVFADTIVICTLTAFAVLMSGTPIEYGQAAGAPLTIAAFSTTFGRAGGVIISVGLTLFATSTILSWCLYGTRCAEFLFKSTKVIKPYQIIFCLVIILGAVTELSLVWDIADTLNGFMAIPNLVGLLGLSPIVIKLTREYFNGVRLGESNRK